MFDFPRLAGGLSVLAVLTGVLFALTASWGSNDEGVVANGAISDELSVSNVDSRSMETSSIAEADVAPSSSTGVTIDYSPPIPVEQDAPMNVLVAFDRLVEPAPEIVTTTSTTLPSTTTTSPPKTTTTKAPAPTTTQAPAGGGGGPLTPSGPITVTKSGTVIENVHFTGNGDQSCVQINGASNVTVRNSRFTNCYKGVYALGGASNVVVTDNVFEADMAGRGRNSVQFNRVSGGYIARNRSTRSNGVTLSEDHINMYMSNGSSSNPIIIEGNVLIGGGPSRSGSGIVLGDGGGSWQIARNNTLKNPGQVGIGAAGGSHMTISGNTVSSESFSWSNVGIDAWDWDGSGCSNVTVTNNNVPFWLNSNGDSNVWWDGQNCSNLVVSGNSWQ